MTANNAERGYVKLSRDSIDDLVLRHFPAFGAHGRAIMTAIALAESGGMVNVVHDNFKSGHQAADSVARLDFGLWQINSQHEFNRTRLLMDPEYNAGAAAEIYERQGFNAWAAWKSERYREFMTKKDEADEGESNGDQSTNDGAVVVHDAVQEAIIRMDAAFRRFDTLRRQEFLSELILWRERWTTI